MKVCEGRRSATHEGICHEEYDCPLCAANEEIEKLQAEIDKLKDDLANKE